MTRLLYAERGAPILTRDGHRTGEEATVLYANPSRTEHVQTEFRRLSEGEAVSDFYGKPAGVVTWADGQPITLMAAE